MKDDRTSTTLGTPAKVILVRTKADSTGRCSIEQYAYDPMYERHIVLKGSEVNDKLEGISGFGIFTKDLVKYFSWSDVTKVDLVNEDHIVNLLLEKKDGE